MAITFEEKSYVGRNISILLAIAAVVVAAAYFIWGFLRQNLVVVPEIPTKTIGINLDILEDPALVALDMFPEITPAANEAPTQNPFVDLPPVEIKPANADSQ
jgi:hypothetical protein